MKKQMVEALKLHAQAHIDKHRMNVEVYLNNPAGVGGEGASAVMDAIEMELNEIAQYEDQLEVLNKYFSE
jgi:hypothetical protein